MAGIPDLKSRMRGPAQVAAMIDLACREKRPLSLIRLGDGESAILGYPEFEPEERFLRWLRNWFGPHALDVTPYVPLKALLTGAISRADIVGTNDNTAFQVEEWRQALLTLGPAGPNPDLNIIERKLLNYHAGPIIKDDAVCVSTNIAIQLHRSGFLTQLVEREPVLTIISGRPVADGIKAAFPDKTVIDIRVPGQAKFTVGKHDGGRFERHFPDVYEGVIEKLSAGDFEGVALVGAGPCGKMYCDTIQRMGGIAIDIGSIMDLWVGLETRSYMKGLREELGEEAPFLKGG